LKSKVGDVDVGVVKIPFAWPPFEHHENAGLDTPRAQAVSEQDQLLLGTTQAELADHQTHAKPCF
jgi:hypothetical protein